MCETNQPNEQERKPLADLKDFDPKKVGTSKVQTQDVTEQVRVSGVQIIGSVPPAAAESEPDNHWTWLRRGDDHTNYSEYQQAFECYDRAVTALRTEKPPWGGTEDLKAALVGKANSLSRLQRHAEALPCYDEALALDEASGGAELPFHQADTVMNKGLALANAGRREEALTSYYRVLAVCRREWANGSESAGSLVALTLLNTGACYLAPGEYESALQKYDEALEIHRALAAKRDGTLSIAAAIVLTYRSRALIGLERFDEALAAAQQAVNILEPEVPKFGGGPLRLDLSLALLRQGKALAGLVVTRKRATPSSVRLNWFTTCNVDEGRTGGLPTMNRKRAKATRRKTPKANEGSNVIFARGQDVLDPVKGDAVINQILDQLEADGLVFAPEDKGADRAQQLLDEGIAFASRGEHQESLASIERALAVCHRIKDKRRRLYKEANLLANKGATLGDLERHAEAVKFYDDALTIDKQVARKNDPQRTRDRAMWVMNRGIALMNLGRHKYALESLHEALQIVERLVSAGHTEFASDIALAHYNVGEARIRAGQFDDALIEDEKAIAQWRRLAVDGRYDADIGYAHAAEGDALMQLGRYDEALVKADECTATFRRLFSADASPKLTGDLAGMLNLRGAVLSRLGRLQEAQACFREAASLRDGVDRDSPAA